MSSDTTTNPVAKPTDVELVEANTTASVVIDTKAAAKAAQQQRKKDLQETMAEELISFVNPNFKLYNHPLKLALIIGGLTYAICAILAVIMGSAVKCESTSKIYDTTEVGDQLLSKGSKFTCIMETTQIVSSSDKTANPQHITCNLKNFYDNVNQEMKDFPKKADCEHKKKDPDCYKPCPGSKDIPTKKDPDFPQGADYIVPDCQMMSGYLVAVSYQLCETRYWYYLGSAMGFADYIEFVITLFIVQLLLKTGQVQKTFVLPKEKGDGESEMDDEDRMAVFQLERSLEIIQMQEAQEEREEMERQKKMKEREGKPQTCFGKLGACFDGKEESKKPVTRESILAENKKLSNKVTDFVNPKLRVYTRRLLLALTIGGLTYVTTAIVALALKFSRCEDRSEVITYDAFKGSLLKSRAYDCIHTLYYFTTDDWGRLEFKRINVQKDFSEVYQTGWLGGDVCDDPNAPEVQSLFAGEDEGYGVDAGDAGEPAVDCNKCADDFKTAGGCALWEAGNDAFLDLISYECYDYCAASTTVKCGFEIPPDSGGRRRRMQVPDLSGYEFETKPEKYKLPGTLFTVTYFFCPNIGSVIGTALGYAGLIELAFTLIIIKAFSCCRCGIKKKFEGTVPDAEVIRASEHRNLLKLIEIEEKEGKASSGAGGKGQSVLIDTSKEPVTVKAIKNAVIDNVTPKLKLYSNPLFLALVITALTLICTGVIAAALQVSSCKWENQQFTTRDLGLFFKENKYECVGAFSVLSRPVAPVDGKLTPRLYNCIDGVESGKKYAETEWKARMCPTLPNDYVFTNKYDGDKKQDCWFAGSEAVQPLTEVPETAGYKDTRTSGGGIYSMYYRVCTSTIFTSIGSACGYMGSVESLFTLIIIPLMIRFGRVKRVAGSGNADDLALKIEEMKRIMMLLETKKKAEGNAKAMAEEAKAMA